MVIEQTVDIPADQQIECLHLMTQFANVFTDAATVKELDSFAGGYKISLILYSFPVLFSFFLKWEMPTVASECIIHVNYYNAGLLGVHAVCERSCQPRRLRLACPSSGTAHNRLQ